jgi:hypothetical protein
MANAFSDNAIRGAEAYILETIKTWTDILGAPKEGSKKDEWSQGRDMTKWSTFLSFDLLSNLAFGAPLHTMSSEEKRYIPELVTGFTIFAYTVSISNLSTPVSPLRSIFPSSRSATPPSSPSSGPS